MQQKRFSVTLTTLILAGMSICGCVAPGQVMGGLPNSPATQAQVLRGRYLVTASAACADCHAGQDPANPAWLAGYQEGNRQAMFQVGSYTIYAPNITPDKETGIGDWSPAQIYRALEQGLDDEGNILCPPMPWPAYRNLTAEDRWAIVAYLKSIKPVSNKVPDATGTDVTPGKHPACSQFYTNLKPLSPYPAGNEIAVGANMSGTATITNTGTVTATPTK